MDWTLEPLGTMKAWLLTSPVSTAISFTGAWFLMPKIGGISLIGEMSRVPLTRASKLRLPPVNSAYLTW